jgi:D-sedoheptulose 7-phosphate isomerase
MAAYFDTCLAEHERVVGSLRGLGADVEAAALSCVAAISGGGKILLCGNGGSASDCLHLAGELVGRLKGHRRSLPAVSLTADPAVLTCIANDYGYEQVFARQVEGLGRPGDVLLALSTSGASANVIRAVEAANAAGITTIGLLGGSGGALRALCSRSLVVAATTDTARIQECHILIGHAICALVEQHLAGAGAPA